MLQLTMLLLVLAAPVSAAERYDPCTPEYRLCMAAGGSDWRRLNSDGHCTRALRSDCDKHGPPIRTAKPVSWSNPPCTGANCTVSYVAGTKAPSTAIWTVENVATSETVVRCIWEPGCAKTIASLWQKYGAR